MKLEEKVIWLFKTKLSGLRNYDGKDLAISFQSQITVRASASLRGEQLRFARERRGNRAP